jgi:uncharacterized protein involved in exopolysaccharide biosynthesis
MEESEEDSGQAQAGGLQLDLLKSYSAFARHAIRTRWLMVSAIAIISLGLTVAITVLFPRTYQCRTVMMALGSSILDGNNSPNALSGAEGLISRHENLEALIRTTGLLRNSALRRPPLLRAKDRVVEALFGEPDEKTKMAILVGTLESKLDVSVEKGELAITAQWSDGQTAAELAEAARESFLNARHTAEVSAFEDKMAILDGHATKLREEVAALADQMNATHQGGTAGVAATPTTPGAAPRPVGARSASRAPDPLLIEEISGLREKLATDKPKLAEREADWARRVRDEQGKLAEMKLRLTPSHPEVVTEEEKIAMLSQVPSDVAQLRAEVATLESDLKARGVAAPSRVAMALAAATAPNSEPLPTEILLALQKDDTDPALRAQLSGAVIRYGDLRDGIRAGRIDLDTAQAAFNHRYQIIVPAEAPSKPIKPKPAAIFFGGFFVSMLLAFLIPILSELRKGTMIERWQVQHLQLPILAELELPRHTD